MIPTKESYLLNAPPWIKADPSCIIYETIVGSQAFGTNTEESDIDVFAICVPPARIVFPHTTGYISGFGQQPDKFEQYHYSDTESDITVYSIIKFFNLCMTANPTILDCLFVSDDLILKTSSTFEILKENREMFLSQKAYHTYRGYAHEMMKKMRNKNPEGKRKQIVEKYGYDTKYLSHAFRLLLELDNILKEGNPHLRKNKGFLRQIREGNYSLEEMESLFKDTEEAVALEKERTKLPYSVDEEKIKDVLIRCLEDYYKMPISYFLG